MKKITGLAMISLLLSGCMAAGFSVANGLAGFSGHHKLADIAYGDEARQKLDIYTPKQEGKNLPVIVFFYGGSWKSGSKDDYRFAAEPFTSAGYVVVIADYAQYPAFRYPTFVQDAAKAVSWVEQHINDYGGDAKHIIIAGHSAGAHIGALLVTDAHYLNEAGGSRNNIVGFAGLAGPYDFVPEDQDIVAIFAPAGDQAKSAMSANHVDGTQPPMLLLWGEDDDVVWAQNIESMQLQVKKHGGKLEVKTYPGVGHIGIIGALSKPLRGKAPVVEDMLKFFDTLTR